MATTSPHQSSAVRRRAPLAVAAGVAALWAAVVSYAPVLALAAAAAAGSGAAPAGVARLALAGWLLGHGVDLETPADRITLTPLALTALAAWRVARAGVHASRAHRGDDPASWGRPLVAAGAVAACYGLLGVLAAVIVDGPELTVSPVTTGLTLCGFAFVAAGIGGVGRQVRRRWSRRVPTAISAGVRAGTTAAALILAAGAAAAGVALATHAGDAVEMLGTYQAGVLGQAGITAVCLAYAPNVVVWSAAYVLGPGFSVGVDTVVSPAQVLLGPVPALPLLAGLPAGAMAEVGPFLLAVPFLAAACAGWLVSRRWAIRTGWPIQLTAAALAGPVAGVVLAAAAIASSGGLGSGRLSQIGVGAWAAGSFAAVIVSLGAVLGAAVAPLLGSSDRIATMPQRRVVRERHRR